MSDRRQARPLIPELEGLVGRGVLRALEPHPYDDVYAIDGTAAQLLVCDDCALISHGVFKGYVPNVSNQPEAYAWIEQRVKDVGRVGEKEKS